MPLCVAPMFLVSSPALVIAACTSGVAGAFPTPNVRTSAELDGWMKTISDALAKARQEDADAIIGPWAVNLVTHRTNTRLGADLDLVRRYQPPLVITALGSPKPAIDVVHAYGGLVIADVINLELARKAIDAGADGLACVCAGSGGHTGTLSPFAFVSAVRRIFDGLVFAGGGIADGSGILGAVAAGADVVYMGTRFIPAAESIAAPRHKQLVLDADIADVVVSAHLTGTPASWLKQSLLDAGYNLELLSQPPARNYDSNSPVKKHWKDVFAAGQGVGASRVIEPASAIIARLGTEYDAALQRVLAIQSRYG